MPISVTCPKCQAAYRLADQLAGKKAKCPKCQQAITVPKPAPPPHQAKASGSGLLVALILGLGVGLFGCLGCGAVAWWYYDAANVGRPDLKADAGNDTPPKNKIGPETRDKKQTDTGKTAASAKDKPPVNATKDSKSPPPDAKKDNEPPAYIAVGGYLHRTLPLKKGTRLVGDLVWARDGKSFYALTETGLLQQFSGDSGAILKEKDYAQKCGNLAISGQGLLLSMLDAQEVWLVDLENLDAVKKKIAVPSIMRVTAGMDASYAVAGTAKAGLHVIDLERGAVVKSFADFAARHVRASPDGRFVFAQGDAEQLVRFRLDKDQLVQEDASRIALDGQSVCISPDSQYVCLAAADGNGQGHPNHPPASPRATFIYPVTNLKRPICVLNSGPNPQAVGFDPKGGFIVTQNNVKPIIIYTYTGIKRAEFEVADVKGSDIREFAVSPLGFEMLLRADDRIVHVKLTKKQ